MEDPQNGSIALSATKIISIPCNFLFQYTWTGLALDRHLYLEKAYRTNITC